MWLSVLAPVVPGSKCLYYISYQTLFCFVLRIVICFMKNTFTFKVFNFYGATFNLFSQDLPGLCFSNLQIRTLTEFEDNLSHSSVASTKFPFF